MRKINLLIQYLSYKIFGPHAKGHGIHSPFVFDFIINVLNNDYVNDDIIEIEKYRKKILRNKDVIDIEDFGAGSKKRAANIGKIIKIASVNPKFGRLLYRIVRYYNPEIIVELGTLAGIGTLYLSKSAKSSNVYTIEGDPYFANKFKEEILHNNIQNITVINDVFKNAIPSLKDKFTDKTALFYIDGNHKKENTLSYFSFFAENIHENSIIIIDDIRWSAGMTEAWEIIKNDEKAIITIDLFFMGIIFFRKNIKKQNFLIRF